MKRQPDPVRALAGGMAGGTEEPYGTAVATAVFGDRLGQAEDFARLLAGPGVERGLIGPREVERLWDRHLLNCAGVAQLIAHESRVADIGSGAGLPGLVLAIARPDLDVVLIESRLRPTVFLSECVEELGLSRVGVRRARAEELTGRVTVDVVTARAVTSLTRLAQWSRPLLAPGGQLLALKGDNAASELADNRSVLMRAGWQDAEVVRTGATSGEPSTTVVRLVAGS